MERTSIQTKDIYELEERHPGRVFLSYSWVVPRVDLHTGLAAKKR